MKQPQTSLETLKSKKSILEGFLREYLESCEASAQLKSAYTYALETGGKRLRPIITLLFGEATPALLHSALSLELFHTCSLIADDLPCMDDEKVRRDHPALHIAFPESTALLASYGMLCAAFEQITIAGALLKLRDANERTTLAIRIAAELSGLRGATGGQFLDLNADIQTKESLTELFYKKTVTLFELAFVLGHLFSGKPIDRVDQVRDAAYAFGMAFQIADDIDDADDNDPVNAVNILGEEEALRWFKKHLDNYETSIALLDNPSDGFTELASFMKLRTQKKRSS